MRCHLLHITLIITFKLYVVFNLEISIYLQFIINTKEVSKLLEKLELIFFYNNLKIL